MIESRATEIPRAVRWPGIIVAAALLISIVVRSTAAWKYWGDLEHNSPGTWLCMAQDARNGMLYRPIESNLGYGGTRYAPLFPAAIAGGMCVGMSAVTSGFVVGLIATGLAIGGIFVLMRKLGTPTAVAGAMAIFILAATCTRTIVLGIKGDLLPVGLTLWGLAAVVCANAKERSHWALIIAATCFALALAAKITSVFGIVAAVIWLLVGRKYRQSAILLGAWVAAIIAIAIVIQYASHGEAKTIFLQCAGGGGTLARMLKGPRLLAGDAIGQDKTLVILWTIAVLTIAGTRKWMSAPAIFLLLTTAGTILIYGSPGTHINHFVDMNAAAILVIGTLGLQSRALRWPVLGITMLAMLLAAVGCWRQAGEIRHNDVRGQMMAALTDARWSPVDGPILAEDPLLAILDGQRPYMLDPFMFRAIRSQEPDIADRLWNDLAQRRFKAVILHKAPSDPSFSADDNDFGPGFIDRLEQGYALTSVHGGCFVMLPKP